MSSPSSTPDPVRAAAARKPWPLRWIVVAILVVIVPYTYVNLKFRKPNKAFEPYADMKSQANVGRLLDAGFRRVTLPVGDNASASAATSAAGPSATFAPAPGGLPAELGEVLVEAPRLPLAYREVSAPAAHAAAAPLRLSFALASDPAAEGLRIGAVELYLRDQSAVLVPVFAPATAAAPATPTVLACEVPAGLLAPGTHVFTLAGARDSVRWTVLVR
jgi:hypothetical protein